MRQIIALDIETIPQVDALARFKSGFDPSEVKVGNVKDPALIAAKVGAAQAAHEAGAAKACSLDPMWGRVASVAMWDGETPFVLTLGACKDDEHLLLNLVAATLLQVDIKRVVTFNGANFDCRWLRVRMAVHGIAAPACLDARRYHSLPVTDLMQELSSWQPALTSNDGERVKGWHRLEEWCEAFGVEGKTDGLTGADVWPMAQRGEWDRIAEYNSQDARATWNLYVRLRDCGLIGGAE